jgi:hypothetical protein
MGVSAKAGIGSGGDFHGAFQPGAGFSAVVIPGHAGIAVGAIGLGAATLASTTAFRPYWLEVWLMAAVLAGGAGAWLVIHRALGAACGPIPKSVRRVFACLLPSLIAGAILTAVLAHGAAHAIPGMWLLLYGCALVYASSVTSKAIAILGGLFMVVALVAFGAPESEQMSILGVGFGELHILYALLMKHTGPRTRIADGRG